MGGWEDLLILGALSVRRHPINNTNGGFSPLARPLNTFDQGPAKRGAAKGRKQMSSQSSVKRTFLAISAAIAMSTVAVGAAVGPAQAASAHSEVAAHA